MEINLPGLIISLLLVLIIMCFGCMVILLILQSMGLINFKSTGRFIIISVALGIAVTIIFGAIRFGMRKNNPDDVIKVASSESLQTAIDRLY